MSLDVIGRGDETWRAITPCFTEKYIYYAMDAEFFQNHIYKLDRSSLRREMIGNINGPSYYNVTLDETPIVATTSELCPSQTSPESQISIVNDNHSKVIASYRKDFFGHRFFVKYFQAGLIEFSYASENLSTAYFSSQGLLDIKNKVFNIIQN